MLRKHHFLSMVCFLVCAFFLCGCTNSTAIFTSTALPDLTEQIIQPTSFPIKTPTLASSPLTITAMPTPSNNREALAPDLSQYAIDDVDLLAALTPLEATLNSNGLTRFSSVDEKNIYRQIGIIETSQASQNRIQLILLLIYNNDTLQMKKNVMEIKSKHLAESYLDLSYVSQTKMPEETWVLSKENEVLELGTYNGNIEIYIILQSNLLTHENRYKFDDVERAVDILVNIAAKQINKIKYKN